MRGKVIKSTGLWCELLTEEGEKIKARLKGIFKQDDLKTTNPIAVGDEVQYELTGDGMGTIYDIVLRKNYIIRKSTHKSEHTHIIASNIDQAILIATIDFPRTSIGFIDRFLVSAESFRIPTVLVINKIDLLIKKKHVEALAHFKQVYESAGYKVLLTSVVTGEGIDEFKQLFKQKTSLVSGHSGVGKSTLVNTINKDLHLKTGEISTFANKGKHTTTFAEMFCLEDGVNIIDTPGIKELGINDIADTELGHYFPEMRALLGQCKFNNCTHTHEPDCAVLRAVNEGTIHKARYESYLGILFEEDDRR